MSCHCLPNRQPIWLLLAPGKALVLCFWCLIQIPLQSPPHASSVREQARWGCRAFPASGQKGHVKIKSTWLYLQATKERAALPRKTFPCKRILNLPFDCHCWNDGFAGLKFKTLSASFLLAVIYEWFCCWLSSKITTQQPWQTSRGNFTG